MGWFGSICSAIGTVGSFLSGPTGMVLGAAWNVGKWALGKIFKDRGKVTGPLGGSDPIDMDKATTNEVQKINNLLADFKNDKAIPQAKKMEKKFEEVASKSFDILLDTIDEANRESATSRFPMQFSTKQVRVERDRTLSSIKDTLTKEITSKISIDNNELKEILKLPKGEEKKQRTDKFIVDSLKDSVKTLQRNMDNSMRVCAENIHEKLENRLDDMQDRAKRDLDTLMQLKNSEGKEAQEKEKSQIQLISQMWLMQNASNLLQDSKLA